MDSGALLKLIVLRFVAMIGILIVLAAIVFGLERFTPADPVHVMLGANASPATIAAATPPARLRQAAPAAVRRRTSATSRTATCRCRCAPAGRSRPTSPTTSRRRSSSRSPAWCSPAIIGVALGLATALRVRGSGVRARRAARARVRATVPARAARHPASSTDASAGCPRPAARRFSNAPTGPTKLLVVDGLLHWRWDVVVDAIEAPRPARAVRRVRARVLDRPGAALEPRRHDEVRPRAHRAGEGPARVDGRARARAAQLDRSRAVDGRPAGRA